MGEKTQGVRVYPNAEGWLEPREIDQPARYGQCTSEHARRVQLWWQVTTPDGIVGCLNPEIHTVDEHEDGTITVSQSLDNSKRKPGGWHGYLRRGVFESC